MRRIGLAVILAVSLTLAPFAVEAQTEKVYRIGILERTSPANNAANLDGFRRGLRELGYVEEKNFVIDYRSADGRDERLPALATELVRLKVDLIVTRGTPGTLAATNATGTIPVVTIRQGPRPDDPAVGAGAGGPGDRVARARPTRPTSTGSTWIRRAPSPLV
jgi:putative tryptophan/tyrosine transport system substrate-binding protein